jgi:hypothetical protein
VSFTGTPATKTYLVKVLLSDGRGLQRTLKASQHSVSIPAVAKGVRARITVTAIGPDGRRGPAQRASLG